MESDEGNNENLIRTVRVYVFDGSDGSLTGYHHADLSDKNVTEKSFNIRLGSPDTRFPPTAIRVCFTP